MARFEFTEPGGPLPGRSATSLSRDERAAMAAMRYGDGREMRRGDEVAIAGEPGRERYRIVGWDLGRCRVLLLSTGGRVHRIPPAAIARCSDVSDEGTEDGR